MVSVYSHTVNDLSFPLPSGQERAGTGRDSDLAAPPEMPIVIDHVALKDILGPQLFEMEVSTQPNQFQTVLLAKRISPSPS